MLKLGSGQIKASLEQETNSRTTGNSLSFNATVMDTVDQSLPAGIETIEKEAVNGLMVLQQHSRNSSTVGKGVFCTSNYSSLEITREEDVRLSNRNPSSQNDNYYARSVATKTVCTGVFAHSDSVAPSTDSDTYLPQSPQIVDFSVVMLSSETIQRENVIRLNSETQTTNNGYTVAATTEPTSSPRKTIKNRPPQDALSASSGTLPIPSTTRSKLSNAAQSSESTQQEALAPGESRQEEGRSRVSRRYFHNGLCAVLIGLSLLLTAAVLYLLHTDLFELNGWCSPVMPGMTVSPMDEIECVMMRPGG